MGFKLLIVIAAAAIVTYGKPTPDEMIKGVFISAEALKELQEKAHQNSNQAIKDNTPVSVIPGSNEIGAQTTTPALQDSLNVDATVKTNPQPLTVNQQPLLTNQQTGLPNQQPAVPNQQVIVNQQQGIPEQQTTMINQQPAATNQQTVLVNQQPATTNQQTVLVNQQPTTSIQQSGSVQQNQQPLLVAQGTNPQTIWVTQQPNSINQAGVNQHPGTILIAQPGGATQQIYTNQPTVLQQPLQVSQGTNPRTVWITQQPSSTSQQQLTNQQPGTILVAQPSGTNQQLTYANQPIVLNQQNANNQQPLQMNQQGTGNQQQPTYINQQPLSNQQSVLISQPLSNQQTAQTGQQLGSTNQQPIFVNAQTGQILVAHGGNLLTPVSDIGQQTYIIRDPNTGVQTTLVAKPLNVQNQPTVLTMLPSNSVNTGSGNTVLIPVQQLQSNSPSMIVRSSR